jgi:hypothetical protein
LRNHYCLDSEIDDYRRGYSYSRADYLNAIKLPDASAAPGPSIRAGDFGEVLVADYLEYVVGYWVPRTRYGEKTIRNESVKGCDIIGFGILDDEVCSPEDVLAIFEAKAQFSGNAAKPRLQDAVEGSVKDQVRKAESLNAIKQRLNSRQLYRDAEKVERFQDPEDRPYKEVFGAAALFSASLFSTDSISATDTTCHPSGENLVLLVIRGDAMMGLVHDLRRVDVDLVAGAPHVPVHDVGQHRERVAQQGFVACGGVVGADGLDIPQRAIDGVVLRRLPLVREAVRNHALGNIVR